jgi:membrane associated rhomboid family serine protease
MGPLTRGVMGLMVVHTLVWVVVQPLGPSAMSVLVMDPGGVWEGEVWRLVTHVFAVRDLGFLAFVLLALVFLAPEVERRLGRNRFLAMYLGSGLVASALLAVVGLVVRQPGVMAGPVASDLAIIAAFAFLSRGATVRLFFALPVKAMHLLLVVVAFRLLGMWQEQAFLWPVACEFAGIGVAWVLTRPNTRAWWADLDPVERYRNWRYRRRMTSLTVHPGGRRPPGDYLN